MPRLSFLLDLNTRTMLGEEYISLSYPIYTFPHSSVTSPLLEYLPQHPILKHSQPTFLPQWERPSFTPTQNCSKIYISVYLNF